MRGLKSGIACVVVAGLLGACQDSVRGQQLDINYATTTGVGSMTASPLALPHGRYTFFSYSDPPNCVKSVALLDHHGSAVVDDGSQRGQILGSRGMVAAQMVPTMVQQELSSGSYRLKVSTNGSGCAWDVEQILNYMLSNEAPLKPLVPTKAPNVDASLGNSSPDLHFQIPVAGIYHVIWNVTPCDRYSGDLVRTGGGAEHLGDGVAAQVPPGGFVGPLGQDGPTFLGAGDWTAKVATTCFWQIGIRPWVGNLGGGTQGFAP
jgi:hypothetical protein